MKRYLFGFVLIALCAGAATAQQTAAPAGRSIELRTASPFRLARAVNRAYARNERTRAGDEVMLAETWKLLGVPAGDFDKCSYCRAQLFRHELDGAPGRELLLKLGWEYRSFRYLVFKQAGRGRWRFVGLVDHDFNRYAESSHRVARAAGRNWLVVWGQKGSGSGYALYGETWYEVGAGGLRPVLHYPAEGRVVPWPSGVARHLVGRAAGRGDAVELRYTVVYERLEPGPGDPVYFSRNRHRVRYVWNPRHSRFVFDPAGSNISAAEVAAIAELSISPGEGEQIGGAEFFSEGSGWKRGGYDVFLKYNLPRLRRLARRGDEDDREWLREFLNDCADTPARQALEKELDGRR